MLNANTPQTHEVDKSSPAKARLGMWLFLSCCVVHAGFVALTTMSPTTMERPGLLGLNLAVTYGFGLIVLAIVMGLIYNAICGRMEDRINAAGGRRNDPFSLSDCGGAVRRD
jgi:uncharacterized membrane protein (DUF485 family)